MASEAVDKVVSTPELLEMILLDGSLDTKTLHLSQRVNRFFYATIAGSLRLQNALFFKTKTSPTLGRMCPRNYFLVSSYHNKPIRTPEGYSFRVRDSPYADNITFKFSSGYPTPDKPATGSWSRMHTDIQEGACVTAFYRDPRSGERVFKHVNLERQDVTFGQMLDLLEGGKSDRSKTFASWHRFGCKNFKWERRSRT